MFELNAYLRDPCGASALPFWKSEQWPIPDKISVFREDQFPGDAGGRDEPYFKALHDLEGIREEELPPRFEIAPCGIADYAAHINGCYREEGVTAEELDAYRLRPGFDPLLWIAIRDRETGQIAATGIAEADLRIGEGILEWIQVSPEYRRRGLGRFVVSELLRRMRGKVRFVTVSGRLNSPDAPLLLYLSCGFHDPVIWHVVTDEP